MSVQVSCNHLDDVCVCVPNFGHIASEIENLERKFCHVCGCVFENIVIIDTPPKIEKFFILANSRQLIGSYSQVRYAHYCLGTDEKLRPVTGGSELEISGHLDSFEIPLRMESDLYCWRTAGVLPSKVEGPPDTLVGIDMRDKSPAFKAKKGALQLHDRITAIPRLAQANYNQPYGGDNESNGRGEEAFSKKSKLTGIFSDLSVKLRLVMALFSFLLSLLLCLRGWNYIYNDRLRTGSVRLDLAFWF